MVRLHGIDGSSLKAHYPSGAALGSDIYVRPLRRSLALANMGRNQSYFDLISSIPPSVPVLATSAPSMDIRSNKQSPL